LRRLSAPCKWEVRAMTPETMVSAARMALIHVFGKRPCLFGSHLPRGVAGDRSLVLPPQPL
jgi:hypothetical protein